MARPKENERQDVRPLVLAAAQRLFLEHGYHNVTMRRIAREIGYTPGTIYLYFKNKAEILYELHNAGFRRLQERRVRALADGAGGAIEKLAVGGKNYVAFALENPELYELMFFLREPREHIEARRAAPDGPEAAEIDYSLKSYENLKTTLRECMAEGYYPGADLDTTAFFHWALVHGLASLAIRDRVPFPRKPTRELADAVVELLMGLIERTRTGRRGRSRKTEKRP
ncbi:MAG: TetR/AcrR family transcriptional regulator [Thermodesulfobacteriota bacterium]